MNSVSDGEGDMMHHLHVLFEHHEHREALAALRAFEGHALPVFDQRVFSHGGRSVETSPADVARVRPLPRVSPHMFFHVAFQFVPVTTNGTGKRFLAGVSSHVADHLTPCVCFSATDKAGECFTGGLW